MKVRLLFITLLLVLVASPAFAVADLTKLTRLDGVSLYADENESRLVVRFNRIRGVKATPKFYEKSIQIDITGAYITPSKRNFDLGGKVFMSASAYQISPTKVRLRFFLQGDPREYAKNKKISLNSNLMIITLKNTSSPARAEISPVAQEKVEVDKTVHTSKTFYPASSPSFRATADPDAQIEEKQIVTKKVARPKERDVRPAIVDEKSKRIPRGQFPNLFTKKAEASEAKEEAPKVSAGDGFLDYKDPEAPIAPSVTSMAIKMVVALSFTLAAVFALAWIGKKYMGKLGGSFGRSSLINVLATSQIDVKKRIAVVDIAGEVLVLGIAGDNIAMLSTIDDQEKADRFRRAGGMQAVGKGDEKLFAPMGKKIKTSQLASLVKKATGLLRIGEIEPKTASRRSLYDASSKETFEGNLARFAEASGSREEQSSKALGRERLAREALGQQIEPKPLGDGIVYDKKELVRRVTDAIKSKNNKLRIA